MASRRDRLFMIIFSSICICAASGQVSRTRYLRIGPQDVEVATGKIANLQCVFEGAAENCYWSKDGHVVNETLLQFTGNRQSGDCSVAFEVHDVSRGRWQCALPTTPTQDGLVSPNAHVRIAGEKLRSGAGGGGGAQMTPLSNPNDFVTEPSNVTVRSGDNVIMKCVFAAAPMRDTDHCYWEKGDNMVEIVGRYSFVADRRSGDCSISITAVNLKLDDGFWHCGLPQAETLGVKSRRARLTVAVAPKEPKILLHGVEQQTGSDLGVEFNRELDLFCQSSHGNPAAELSWSLGGQELPGTNEVVRDMSFLTARNHLIQTVGEDWRDKELRCTANHPSYDDGRPHFTYVFIRQFRITQKASIVCSSSNDASRTLTLKVDEKADFYCLADGLPIPEYRWETRKDDTEKWHKLVDNIQNLTILGSGPSQDIRCTASNNKFASQAYSVHWTIKDPAGKSSVAGLSGGVFSFIVTCIIALSTTWV